MNTIDIAFDPPIEDIAFVSVDVRKVSFGTARRKIKEWAELNDDYALADELETFIERIVVGEDEVTDEDLPIPVYAAILEEIYLFLAVPSTANIGKKATRRARAAS